MWSILSKWEIQLEIFFLISSQLTSLNPLSKVWPFALVFKYMFPIPTYMRRTKIKLGVLFLWAGFRCSVLFNAFSIPLTLTSFPWMAIFGSCGQKVYCLDISRLIKNLSDSLKTVSIFPDVLKISCWFQNCSDISR